MGWSIVVAFVGGGSGGGGGGGGGGSRIAVTRDSLIRVARRRLVISKAARVRRMYGVRGSRWELGGMVCWDCGSYCSGGDICKTDVRLYFGWGKGIKSRI